LEFAIQASSPYFKRDIKCLEKVQRRATKVVKGFKSLSYEARLHKLGLTTLYDRILRADLIEAYKTRMWANAQPDGRPAEHRWRPLFNAAKFG